MTVAEQDVAHRSAEMVGKRETVGLWLVVSRTVDDHSQNNKNLHVLCFFDVCRNERQSQSTGKLSKKVGDRSERDSRNPGIQDTSRKLENELPICRNPPMKTKDK